MTYSLSGNRAGTKVRVDFDDQKLEGEINGTGSWYTYQTADLGEIYFADTKEKTITVRGLEKVEAAVMNLKALILTPIPEGSAKRITEKDNAITLHSRDSTVLGTVLRYEPKTIKNTLGFWAKPGDKAEWKFYVDKPGSFDLQIFQGCGKGQGGSRVAICIYRGEYVDEAAPALVRYQEFTVKDTGHFQNFVEREVGSVELGSGNYCLRVEPVRKAKNAVMDLREMKLIRKRP